MSSHVSFLLTAGLLFTACATPPPWSVDRGPNDGPSRPRSLESRVLTASHAFTDAALLPDGVVHVRLARFEGAGALTIAGTRRGTVTVERSGEVLRASTGEAGARLHLEPARSSILSLGGQLWPGTLTIHLRAEGGMSVTSRVPLEDYVAGVVARELILWSAEAAELEAQAIAARTYTLSMLGRRLRARTAAPRGEEAFLWSDTRDQAYGGSFMPEDSDGSRRVARRLREAVTRTRGRVLIKGSTLVDARFHAACGGRTASLHEQFPTSPGRPLEPVDCEPCLARVQSAPASTSGNSGGSAKRVRPVTWSTTISRQQLAALAADLDLGARMLSVRPMSLGAAGRWLTVELTGTRGRRTISLEEFRRRLGSRQVASAWIQSCWPHPGDTITGGLFLSGRGRGHGVGLCQTGSHDRAAAGWPATRILLHYYPGARIVTRPAPPTLTRASHPLLLADAPPLPLGGEGWEGGTHP